MQDRAVTKLEARVRTNALVDLVDGLSPVGGIGGMGFATTQTIAMPFTLAEGNSYTPITLNRVLLSYSYMTQGLIQTVIKQPVEDAFRGGFEIRAPELSPEEMRELNQTIRRARRRPRGKLPFRINPNAAIARGYSDQRVIEDVCTWARLYGGAGLVVNTDQDFQTELDIGKIRPDSPLEFIAADRWELILQNVTIWDPRNPTPFNFYGLPLHSSRVVRVLGVEAPSYIRQRLQGWGMSEVERCIRAINSFVKFENLVFELLDEAKIDVYKISGFNDSLLSGDGTEQTQARILLANRLKNYQNALAMDKEDDWNQKQITWSGLAEMWNEIRLNLSAALKIPMNKLFGQSATGFGGGQDALENYNSIVLGVRQDAEPVIEEVVDLRCQQLFGFVPDYTIVWKPLRTQDEQAEEQTRTSKQSRVVQLFQQRLVTGIEASHILRDEGLLRMDTEVSKGIRDVEPTLPNDGRPADGDKKDAPKVAQKNAE